MTGFFLALVMASNSGSTFHEYKSEAFVKLYSDASCKNITAIPVSGIREMAPHPKIEGVTVFALHNTRSVRGLFYLCTPFNQVMRSLEDVSGKKKEGL